MNSAIILGAGKGTRMKANMNKQFLLLKNTPLISHTLKTFDNNSDIDEIIFVINPAEEELIKEKILYKYNFNKTIRVVRGGKERQESVFNGLLAIDKTAEVVLIHDGARPLVTDQIIHRCIVEAKKYGAVVAGVPAKDTIKIVDKNNFVQNTPKRETLWITQTPQAFSTDIIKAAHEKSKQENILGTDDAMLVEKMGRKVKMVMGDYENIKITTPEDLVMAETILNIRENLE